MNNDKKLLIYGKHAIKEAVTAGKTFDKVFLQKGLNREDAAEIRQWFRETTTPIQVVPPEKLKRLTSGIHQGVVAMLSPVDLLTVEQVLPWIYNKGETPLLIVLDGITDVFNFGAIARSAACMNAHAIVIPAKGSAQVNGVAVKASAGGLHKIIVCRETNLATTVENLKLNGIEIITTDANAPTALHQCDLTVPLAIVMGSEDEGVSPQIAALASKKVHIPMPGELDSLNVSVATGVTLYEIVRQRM